MKPTLVITVGYPRSGKSTWARKQGCPIVNPDAIRLALHGKAYIGLAEPFVWAIAKAMTRSLFLAGHDKVILDATNTTQKRRDFWKDDSWARSFEQFNVAPGVCRRRALEDGREDLIPVIDRMAEQFEVVTPNETEEEKP